jgi:peptidoglycan hydrolase-like protein with peptidoglycan-binding domain
MVMRVQLELRAKGIYSGAIDGKMTSDLRDAIRAFQIIQKLPETGSMDDGTLAKLGILY